MEEEQNEIIHHYIIAVKCYDTTHSKVQELIYERISSEI